VSDYWTVEGPDRVVQANASETTVVYERADGAWSGSVEDRSGAVISGPVLLDTGDFTDQYVIGMLDRLTGEVAR